jgi:hypothetical protein
LWRDLDEGKITAMTGIIVLTALVLAIVAALEVSNRRHSRDPRSGLSGGWELDDRDIARTKVDLLALAGRSGPFDDKPFGIRAAEDVFSSQRARHFGWHHGRHAA